jgi:hypothetical protein
MNETTDTRTENVTPFLEVREEISTGYKSLFVRQNLDANVVLEKFTYDAKLKTPTRYTVQISETDHIELSPNYLQYANHNCEPNMFFDIVKMEFVTLRAIEEGEELSFFYPSTEWKMTESFNCICNSSNCLKQIQGAAYLTYDNLVKYRLSEYILDKYRNL